MWPTTRQNMALFTPRTGPRMEHTPRMSERKRGLFQPSPEHFLRSSKTKEQHFQEESEDSEDSCDLGILSPLASGSSSDDYDQSVPQTTNSWRVSTHSTSFDSQRKRSSRIVRNIINSPLTFKNYTTRRSKHDIESPKPGSNRQSITSIEIDAESCSNSLQDLTFHSDNDLSDTKENTPKKNTHYLRKSVRHRYKPAKLMDDDTCLKNPNRKALSPIKNSQITLTHKLVKAEIHSQSFVLKTPDDAMQICKDTPPRVNHRRSMHNMITDDSINYDQNALKRRQRPVDSDSRNTSPRHKYPRLENAPAPKARLSLFGNGDTNHYFSPKSFYSKSNDSLNKSFVSKGSPVDMSITVRPHRHSSGILQRKVYRKRLGDINKGVRHGIRRPKPSKNKPITKSDALKLALNILENSPLNDYINEFMTKQKSTVNISNLDNNSVEDQVISNTDIANATGLSHMQINKMDEILKQVGCKESINKVLGSKMNFKDLLLDTDPNFESSITAPEDMFNGSEETHDSTAGNKFFKNSKAAAFRKATVKLSNNLRLHVKDGKACLPEKKQKDLDGASIQRKLAMLQVISQFDTSDLMQEDDFIDDEKKAINDLLLQWSEEEVPPTEPQAKQHPTDVSKSIEEARCLLNFNTGRSLPVDNIDDETILIVTHDGKQSVRPRDTIQDTNLESSQLNKGTDSEIILSDHAMSYMSNNNSVPNESAEVDQLSNSSDSFQSAGFTRGNNAIQFLPVDGGCIIVGAEMPDESDMPCDLDKIESELEYLDNQISKMAKMNNINPDLLLLPNISQMYSTAPDSILSGPPSESTVSWASVSQSGFEVETSIHQNESHSENNITVESSTKLFPLFVKDSTEKKNQTARQENSKTLTPTTKSKKLCTDKKQYLIDAGQKTLGATQCAECGVIYQDSDAQDKQDHLTHHMALDVLKFNGWKKERLCGRWGEGRAIVVKPGDSAFHWQRVHSLLERVVHPQLGFAVNLDPKKFYKVYLYIEGKQIVGCLVAETLQMAYRLLPGTDIDCCSVESYPVKCGISRIWTHMSFQRRGIATNLVNSMRANFFFGHILACDEIAFSSPTSAGKSFAERYTRTPNFYVYID